MKDKVINWFASGERGISSEAMACAVLDMKPVAWMDREGDIMPMPEIEHWCPPHTMLYTSDQLRQAKVEALREASNKLDPTEAVSGSYAMWLRRMADELEGSMT